MALDDPAEALAALTLETRLLFRSLRRRADELHADAGWHTAARRSVLLELQERGPQPVPELARSRGVSRQDIQTRMDRLRDEGLVSARENPRHRRSPLFELTPFGREELARLLRRERGSLARLAEGLPAARIRAAVRTLALVRGRIETELD